jgi:ATP-dependent Lhr-like helicase
MLTRMFSHPTQEWFERSFDGPTAVQRRGWETITGGRHALLIAPTGSGKTLAAFLAGIDRVAALPPDSPPGVRVLYVSPLKALVYDVERNLQRPLVGIGEVAGRLNQSWRAPRVDVRTGDTPQKLRRQQANKPAEILVTTPESLFLLVGSKARETLRTVHTVIVDEVHALAPTKRGAHLALTLERLCTLTAREPQRIGLSATVNPPAAVAGFLGGDREVAIVDCSAPPSIDLRVVVPVPDMEHPPQGPETDRPSERGLWPSIYPRILERIRANRSTLVFVNSRGLCERLVQRINELAASERGANDAPLVLAHHGSVSHEKRAEIEDGLKSGRARGIVATSSLELGIDMGAIDEVILVESPGSVARGLQRIGRAGHAVGEVSRGLMFPKFRGDLLECAVVAERMREGAIESLAVPRNPLDVLAQQVAAIVCDAPIEVDALHALLRRAAPYRELSRALLESVLDMLAGRYPSTAFADLHPRIAWDRGNDLLSPRAGTAMTVRMNAGTIPDRGQYGVYLGEGGPRVGELDEEMVFETRVGENILLGTSTWRIESVNRDRVIVAPAPGQPGKLPFWHGDGPGRPLELGRAVGAFTRALGGVAPDDMIEWLTTHTPLDRLAAENLAAYVQEQQTHTGTLPTDRDITIERFRDELGDWRLCILSPFGARIHAPWAMALQQRLSIESGFDVEALYTDDGIVLRFADTEALPALDCLLPSPDEAETLVTAQLAHSALFAGLFRENAARALLITRRRPDQRTPLWAQRQKAQQLMATVLQYPAFPLVLETYREALADRFDLKGLRQLLADIRARRVRVHEVETPSASPFARSLVFAYVAAYLYEGDAPLAERKAQALTLDRRLLSELLGQTELRELIDADALAELEAELQHLTDDRRVTDANRLHDLLRRLGDLEPSEIERRCIGGDGEIPAHWPERLQREGRAAIIRIANRQCWIAAEDAAIYRDALGVAPPPKLPDALLAVTHDGVEALEQLALRHARCHGPFTTGELAARYGLPSSRMTPVLEALHRRDRLVRGELRPDGVEPEWCDPDVLRRLKRLTLARLRHEVAAVDGPAFARFLAVWHGIGGSAPLDEAIAQLEGLALPWSDLIGALLPMRVAGFHPDQLEPLAASGTLVWVGAGRLGAKDGRIRLFRRERAARLLRSVPFEPPTPLHAAILDHLATRGASFYLDLELAVARALPDLAPSDFRAALWDLVWAGQITNDGFGPLRGLATGPVRPGRRGTNTLAGGRWSRVADLVDPRVGETERRLAEIETWLERYGVVSREVPRAEDAAGGFGIAYRVLRAMEEAGKLRRGHFVEGLSGSQFARAGAVDRLRECAREEHETDGISILAAIDPANPWGALLDWPETDEAGRPRRVAGAWLVSRGGRPLLHAGPGGRQLVTLTDDEEALTAAFAALHRLPRGSRRSALRIEKIDGEPVRGSRYEALLREAGFVGDWKGMSGR